MISTPPSTNCTDLFLSEGWMSSLFLFDESLLKNIKVSPPPATEHRILNQCFQNVCVEFKINEKSHKLNYVNIEINSRVEKVLQ